MSQNLYAARPTRVARDVLQLIERYNLSPTPPVYELCYRCLVENEVNLREIFDRLIERDGFVSDYEIEYLRVKFVARSGITDRIFGLTESLENEVSDIAKLIGLSLISMAKFHNSLTETQSALTITVDEQELKMIIQAALHATAEMTRQEVSFETALQNSKREIAELQDALNLARAESLTDALTDIPNRRHFDHYIETAIYNASVEERPLTLILSDIDRFKRFNDAHGHQFGDHVLRLIATEMKQAIKGQDFLARFGGEEFAIVLPNTNVDDAIVVANNIRQQIAGRTIVKKSTGERLGNITLSFGVCTWCPGMSASSLIDVADECLYRAKKEGRDRIVSKTFNGPQE